MRSDQRGPAVLGAAMLTVAAAFAVYVFDSSHAARPSHAAGTSRPADQLCLNPEDPSEPGWTYDGPLCDPDGGAGFGAPDTMSRAKPGDFPNVLHNDGTATGTLRVGLRLDVPRGHGDRLAVTGPSGAPVRLSVAADSRGDVVTGTYEVPLRSYDTKLDFRVTPRFRSPPGSAVRTTMTVRRGGVTVATGRARTALTTMELIRSGPEHRDPLSRGAWARYDFTLASTSTVRLPRVSTVVNGHASGTETGVWGDPAPVHRVNAAFHAQARWHGHWRDVRFWHDRLPRTTLRPGERRKIPLRLRTTPKLRHPNITGTFGLDVTSGPPASGEATSNIRF